MAIPLPPAPISTIPQGLLGLLQLKELGQNPAILLNEVAPNLDLLQFYMQRLMQTELGLFGATPQVAFAAAGNFPFAVSGVNATVPQGEMWYVDQACGAIAGATIAPAQTLIAGLAVSYANTASLITLTPREADVINARTRNWATGPILRPQFIGPGAIFQIMVYDSTVGPLTVTLGMRAARIPI